MTDPRTQNPVLKPAWISGDFALPEPAVIANGVVFALSSGENAVQKDGDAKRLANPNRAVLKALDATTGKELYNSAIPLKCTHEVIALRWARRGGGEADTVASCSSVPHG